jgi:hypothetical protein
MKRQASHVNHARAFVVEFFYAISDECALHTAHLKWCWIFASLFLVFIFSNFFCVVVAFTMYLEFAYNSLLLLILLTNIKCELWLWNRSHQFKSISIINLFKVQLVHAHRCFSFYYFAYFCCNQSFQWNFSLGNARFMHGKKPKKKEVKKI